MYDDSVTIARIDQKVISLEQWQAQHDKRDDQREDDANTRFERIFTYIKERHDKTDKKLEELWDNYNKQSGAFKFAGLIASLIGGIIGSALTYFGVHKG